MKSERKLDLLFGTAVTYLVRASPELLVLAEATLPQHAHHLQAARVDDLNEKTRRAHLVVVLVRVRELRELLKQFARRAPRFVVGGFDDFRFGFGVIHHDVRGFVEQFTNFVRHRWHVAAQVDFAEVHRCCSLLQQNETVSGEQLKTQKQPTISVKKRKELLDEVEKEEEEEEEKRTR